MSTTDLLVAVDRQLPAAPQTVFRALTDPALYGLWMGPAGSRTVVEELDLRIGGRLAFLVRLPDGMPDGGPEFRIHGFYEDIDPGRRLVHSWIVEGDHTV